MTRRRNLEPIPVDPDAPPRPGVYPCVWCRQPLRFFSGRGWLHPDGQLIVRRPNGSDDHVALPDRSGDARERPVRCRQCGRQTWANDGVCIEHRPDPWTTEES